jgi:hypothetical protein
MQVQGEFKMQAHIKSGVVMDIAAFKVCHSAVDIDATALRAARARSSFIGALEELSGKVRKASTHSLSSKIHEHARSTAATVSSRGQWMKCHGRFKMQALTACNAKITSTRTANSQFKGAMEEMSQKVQNASSHPTPLRTHKAHGQFSGAMDEMSQKVQKASTHVPMPRSRTRLS